VNKPMTRMVLFSALLCLLSVCFGTANAQNGAVRTPVSLGVDKNGHEIWTSVYRDSEAPYRLASLNAQRRSVGIKTCCSTLRLRTDAPLSGPPSNQFRKERSDAQLRKCGEH
jgi:hypothetical protein